MNIRDVALSCLCATALLTGRAEAKCEVTRMATLHVAVEGNQILVPGTLSGQPVKFLFDTSFPASVITAPAARRLDLPVMDFLSAINRFAASGFTEGAANIHEYQLDGYVVRDATFAIFGQRDNFGTPDLVGVLGTDYWSQFDVEIDLSNGIIQLLKTENCGADVNLAYWTNDYNVLDTFIDSHQTEFNVALNGRKVTAILDSGAPFSSLTRRAAMTYGPPLGSEKGTDVWRPGTQPTDLLALTKMTYGLGTAARPSPDILTSGLTDYALYTAPSRRQTLGDFGSLKMDEEEIKPARLRIMPTPKANPATGSRLPVEFFNYDLALGVDFLLAHHVLFANSQHKLYFSYSGGPALQTVSK